MGMLSAHRPTVWRQHAPRSKKQSLFMFIVRYIFKFSGLRFPWLVREQPCFLDGFLSSALPRERRSLRDLGHIWAKPKVETFGYFRMWLRQRRSAALSDLCRCRCLAA